GQSEEHQGLAGPAAFQRLGGHAQSEDLRRRALELPGRVGLRRQDLQGRRSQGPQLRDRAVPQRAGAGYRRARIDHHLRPARHRRRAAGLGERGLPVDRGTGPGQVRHRRALAVHPGRAAGGHRRPQRRQEGHPRDRAGLPGVPVLAGRPAHRGQELLPPALSAARRSGGRGALPEGAAGDHRWRLRFLGAGAEAALQRWRRIRPDPGRRQGQVTGRPGVAAAPGLPPRLRRRCSRPPDEASEMSTVTNPLTPPAGGVAVSGRRRRVMPGFGLSLGYTVAWLSLIVLIPLAGVFVYSSKLGWSGLWAIWSEPRVLAALKISFGTALAAAAFNAVMGTLVAWVLVRYRFPGRRLFDAMIDLPFALPTAVAGIALTALYGGNGWIGRWLEAAGIKVAYTPLGITVALVFIGLPFVVRVVQPVLAETEGELEEAAATLGAGRWHTVWKVVLPAVWPAVLAGFALAFARGVGEYGSVIFIAGNIPMVSEIAPLLITIKLEEFDYAGATAIALAMLLLSFALLLVINTLQSRLA